MKYSLLIAIKMYWFLIPESKRRKCIFKESCSQIVYKTLIQKGVWKGIQALKFRMKHCKPGYHVINIDGEQLLISINNTVFKEKEINKRVFEDDHFYEK
ncbi:membrane protein insertion efficiency factor YidD [Flavobacteriaceae bacterium R38]|nr:membrane protein insertion efficiency factor YidD [Flavobacteriaceae bacterium R38]